MNITGNPKRRLFIIGNGFDLHHLSGVIPNTSYNSFAAFLKNNKKEIFETLCYSFQFPDDTDNNIWGEFESMLEEFNPEYIFDNSYNFLDDSDPHRSGEASWEAEKYVKEITEGLQASLDEFISDYVKFPALTEDLMLPITQNDHDLYLSFNYTDTLERYYQIQTSRICYIHGKIGRGENLQIGHSVEPNSAPSSAPSQQDAPTNMTDAEKEAWQDYMNGQYSLSTDWLYGAIDGYWVRSFKNTKTNITNHWNFFAQVAGIDYITILGHSLSSVDLPYLKEIKKKASPEAVWRVSYHTDDDMKAHSFALSELGILPNFIIHAPLRTILT